MATSSVLRSPLGRHRNRLYNEGLRKLRAVSDDSKVPGFARSHLPTEIRELMDAGMGYVDSSVYQCLVPHTPKMMPFTAAAALARFLCTRLGDIEDPGFLGDRRKSLALVLQPFSFTLPAIGWIIAIQNLLAGIEYMFSACEVKPAWILANPCMNNLHLCLCYIASTKVFLAKVVAVLVRSYVLQMMTLGTVTWTVLQLKHNFFEKTLQRVFLNTTADMRRALLPIDTLFTWVIIGLSFLLSLKMIGLDPSPLLTVGSVSGIVVGFASQQLLLNLMSGISIFITQTFVVGDFVDVNDGSALLISGTVAQISPLRTTFIDSNGQAVSLPNKQFTDLIITKHGDTGLLTTGHFDENPQEVKQMLSHEIILRRPSGYGSAAYDDLAEKLISALLVRLSVLPNIKKESARAYVCNLTEEGEIVIRVRGTAVHSDKEKPEAARQTFLLAIHNVYNTTLAKEESSN